MDGKDGGVWVSGRGVSGEKGVTSAKRRERESMASDVREC